MAHLLEHTIASAAEGLASGAFTSVELTKAYLDQIRGLDQTLNAYLTVMEEEALEMAQASDDRRAKKQELGPLDGVPIAIKDNILVKDVRATGGSAILKEYIAPYDATVIQRLREAGAVLLGKTNMDEFGMGSSTENSAFGVTKHPRDYERVAGGSSGGSAAAVAADMAVAALGTDTGGSIRLPASFCGLVGFKPSYGRVSRYGIMAYGSSLDQVGPMTKTVKDAATLFEIFRGTDTHDQTTVDAKDVVCQFPKRLDGVRIGLPRQAWGEGMTPEVREHMNEGIAILKSLGAEIKEVDLPYADEALAVYYILAPCEVSTNLSRLDGIRYGSRVKASNLVETYTQSRGQGFNPETRRRILLGTYALSKGYYDAYYRQAKKVQVLIRKAYEKAFEEVDLLVTPTSPTVAFKIGEKTTDPLAMYLQDVFTVSINVAGLPALSISCGDHAGMPVGLQMIGPRFEDARVLDIAYAFEQARM